MPLSRCRQRRSLRELFARLMFAGILLALCLPTGTPAYEGEHRNVLILHSYHAGLRWTDSIMAGMQEVLATSDVDIRAYIEYLDAQRFPETEYFSEVLDAIYHYKLEERRFDLILLSDNDALNFVLRHRNDLFAGTPVVFCGINNFHPDLLAGQSDITGIPETPSFRGTIETALRLHPGTQEIVVIGGRQNVTSRENRRMLSQVIDRHRFPVRFVFWDDVSIEDLQAMLARLPGDRLVLINGSVIDRAGQPLPYLEGMRAIRKASPRPLYSFWDFFLGEGIVGGKLVSGELQGRAAAQMGLRILAGEDADSIPVPERDNRFMFDYRELKRFNLSARQLPQGSVIVNQPPPIYALSKEQLSVGLGIMSVLVGLLLVLIILRGKAQRALQQQKQWVDLLLASTAEAIYGIDPQGLCTFCNPAALRLLGYREENQLLGKNIHDLIHHTRQDGSPNLLVDCSMTEAIRNAQPVHLKNETLWRADGTSFPAELWSHPIRQGGETIGAVVNFLDISERQQAEMKMEQALRELNAFVYTVSHDLRSPLTAIIGFSEFLKDNYPEPMEENIRIAVEEIHAQGERMVEMMEDLLALARVGKLPLPEEPVETSEVVEEVLRELSGQLAAAGLEVKRERLPAVRLPRTLLTQIFSNLIGNAARYAGPAGGPIEISGRREGRRIRFLVRDHGPGVREEERERIFNAFFRGAAAEKSSGTGIGLATVQKIAGTYGGRAWVDDTPGGGASFWVEIIDERREESRE